jgi:hypothetical protein
MPQEAIALANAEGFGGFSKGPGAAGSRRREDRRRRSVDARCQESTTPRRHGEATALTSPPSSLAPATAEPASAVPAKGRANGRKFRSDTYRSFVPAGNAKIASRTRRSSLSNASTCVTRIAFLPALLSRPRLALVTALVTCWWVPSEVRSGAEPSSVRPPR